MNKKERSHDRAPGQTAISFSISEELKKKLMIAANQDNRTLSNYLQTLVKEHLDAKIKLGSVAQSVRAEDS